MDMEIPDLTVYRLDEAVNILKRNIIHPKNITSFFFQKCACGERKKDAVTCS